MSAGHLQLLHLWSQGVFFIFFIYTPHHPAQMKKESVAFGVGWGGVIPPILTSGIKLQMLSAGGVRSGKQGESFSSSFLTFCPSFSSCPVLSLCTGSCPHRSMVCLKEAESARHWNWGFISHQDCLKEDAAWLVVLQETFFVAAAGFNEASRYIALMASASFLLGVQKLNPE